MVRYWKELTLALNAPEFDDLAISCPLGEPPSTPRRAPRWARAWAKYFAYPLRTRLSSAADVVHVLDHSFAHLLRWVPRQTRRIVTVHDLAPLSDPALSAAQRARFRQTLGWLRHADLLLAVSHYTEEKLAEFLGGGPPIVTLAMGVSMDAFATARPLPGAVRLPAGPCVLSIGSNLRRKNLEALPSILAKASSSVGAVNLLRVGDELPAPLREALQGSLGGGHLVEFGRCNDELVGALYQHADALIFPSTLEGFGLPLIEAMSAGCPVVSSNASSLAEVAGNAALLFPPEDVDAGAAHLAKVLTDRDLRQQLIQRGRERVQQFSWHTHAHRVAAFYRTITPGR